MHCVAHVSDGPFSALAEPSTPAPRGRVLIADDDPATRSLLAKTLESQGYAVDAVTDGHQALACAARGDADVFLLDARMWRMSGIDACRALKSGRAPIDLPVLMLVAKTDVVCRIQALQAGADGCVSKPLDAFEPFEQVAAVLRLKRAREQALRAQCHVEHCQLYDEATETTAFRQLRGALARAFAHAETHTEPLACGLIHVDRSRDHNAVDGRRGDDRALRTVARVLQNTVRDADVVARFAEDEFLILLPNANVAGSLVVASRVLRALRRTPGEGNEPGEQGVRVSLGLATFPSRDVRTVDALLGAAAAALRESKRHGGDGLCVFRHEGALYVPPLDTD